MAWKFQVTTTTALTSDGLFGAWMFILAPVVQYLGWLWFSWGLFKALFMATTGLAFLIGFVLLLTGRVQHSKVDEIQPPTI